MTRNKNNSELRNNIFLLKKYFFYTVFFSIISSLLVLAPSGYMLEVYERVVNSGSHTTLLWLTVILISALILMEFLEWARSETMRYAGIELDKKLYPRVFNLIFDSKVKNNESPSTQPLSDLRRIIEFLYSAPFLAILEIPVALLMMVLLYLISPILGWMALLFGVLQGLVTLLNEKSTKPAMSEANRFAYEAQQHAENTLQNSEVIEAMGILKNTHKKWLEKQKEFLRLQSSASYSAGGFQALSKFLQTLLSSSLLGVSCWLMLNNELNGGPGMMVISSILGGRMLAPFVLLIAQWKTLVSFRDAWERLDDLLSNNPPENKKMSLPEPIGDLKVEPLMVINPINKNPIIKGISFDLDPGDVLAVVGPSASGKTTLARALVGLWYSSAGKVRLDGVDIYEWNKKEVGPFMGYLPQGIELFEGSIAENISRFGKNDINKVVAAAKSVGLHELITSMPNGYETLVGKNGAKLSGGQKQRIGLARALYGNPNYIVLDEPNSSLDEEGDRALSRAITEAKSRNATVIVITHRTSILKVANKMLLIKDGIMQDFGPRDEVLSRLKIAAGKSTAEKKDNDQLKLMDTSSMRTSIN